MHEFDQKFRTETNCLDYLASLRWKNGFVCSKCGSDKFWILGDGSRKCTNCSFHNSVTAGTIFQDSHLSIKTWFYAIWWVTTQKTGISAVGLKGVLGLGSYHTAWLMLQKIRRMMVIAERQQLQKEVEVDETLVGGFMSGKFGRDHAGKTLVIIAAEVDGRKIGRIRMKRLANATSATLHSFIKSEISPGSVVHTDGWKGYWGIDKYGFIHDKTTASSVGEDELMPKVHLIASLLKRWLLGTFQGRPMSKYLDHYLDEYVFRFNRRKSNARGLLFYRVLENAVITSPSTSADIKQN